MTATTPQEAALQVAAWLDGRSGEVVRYYSAFHGSTRPLYTGLRRLAGVQPPFPYVDGWAVVAEHRAQDNLARELARPVTDRRGVPMLELRLARARERQPAWAQPDSGVWALVVHYTIPALKHMQRDSLDGTGQHPASWVMAVADVTLDERRLLVSSPRFHESFVAEGESS